jgi:anti-sigma B factor antagonist
MCQAISQTTETRLAGFDVVLPTDTAGSCVQLCGELDVVTASDLEWLLDQLRRDGHRQVTLDLSRLEFLSVAGLSVLLRADHALHAAGGRLVFTRPTGMARRILAITGLDTALTIHKPTEWVASGDYVNAGGAQ